MKILLLLLVMMLLVVDGVAYSAENVALNKIASQSSEFGNSAADKAVDGNTNGNFSQGSVSITNASNQSWWQVDLGTIYTFNKISIWNRTDAGSERLSDFYIFVSNENINLSHSTVETMLDDPDISANFVGQAGTHIDIEENFSGRFVRIQLKGSNYLQLAEVEVWTDFQPICGVVCTETVLNAKYEAGRQSCINNPKSCNIDVVATTLSTEFNLNIPLLQYNSPFEATYYWANLEYVGEINDTMHWKLSDYGQK